MQAASTQSTIRQILLTALAPIIWGTTDLVTTEYLPADRPFLAAILRTLPAGILLIVLTPSARCALDRTE